jgi:hypothetical protein
LLPAERDPNIWFAAVYAPGNGTQKRPRAEQLEQMVWTDLQEFLRLPGVVIEQLRGRLRNDADETVKDRERLNRLRGLLEGKAAATTLLKR